MSPVRTQVLLLARCAVYMCVLMFWCVVCIAMLCYAYIPPSIQLHTPSLSLPLPPPPPLPLPLTLPLPLPLPLPPSPYLPLPLPPSPSPSLSLPPSLPLSLPLTLSLSLSLSLSHTHTVLSNVVEKCISHAPSKAVRYQIIEELMIQEKLVSFFSRDIYKMVCSC